VKARFYIYLEFVIWDFFEVVVLCTANVH